MCCLWLTKTTTFPALSTIPSHSHLQQSAPLSNWQVGAKTAKTSDISCVETQIFEHGLFLDVTQELGLLEVIAPVIKVCSIEWSLGTCIGSMGRTLLPSGFFD
jgi:hypothetical protein